MSLKAFKRFLKGFPKALHVKILFEGRPLQVDAPRITMVRKQSPRGRFTADLSHCFAWGAQVRGKQGKTILEKAFLKVFWEVF